MIDNSLLHTFEPSAEVLVEALLTLSETVLVLSEAIGIGIVCLLLYVKSQFKFNSSLQTFWCSAVPLVV